MEKRHAVCAARNQRRLLGNIRFERRREGNRSQVGRVSRRKARGTGTFFGHRVLSQTTLVLPKNEPVPGP